jgi:hypothetical protein
MQHIKHIIKHSTSTAPKKKKRKRRPAAPHPDAPPPTPSARIKTEEPRPGDASGDPMTTDNPPLRKIKKEEGEEGAY